ncbi:MAG: hypothetical protein HN348_11810 [Proteobacteria bacterium]|jgi:hypothetical protein|nr:hypothetical protein [Pseudomonadota bacterium]
MTEASQRALEGMRDLTTMEWYFVPLMAIIIYIYTFEMQRARRTGNWDAIYAGLTIFGMDCINETVNGWIFHFTQRSALWTTPGTTAFRVMIGWNIEIIFMFAIAGIVFYNTVSDDPKEKILGIPNRWFWAIVYAAFAVFIECLLNAGGLLVWEYPFWNRSFAGVWLIFLFGYFHFYVAAIIVISLKKTSHKIGMVSALYAITIAMNLFGMGLMGWDY